MVGCDVGSVTWRGGKKGKPTQRSSQHIARSLPFLPWFRSGEKVARAMEAPRHTEVAKQAQTDFWTRLEEVKWTRRQW